MALFSRRLRLGKERQRRLIGDRRWCQDRRIVDLPVETERRGGDDRRTGEERRRTPEVED